MQSRRAEFKYRSAPLLTETPAGNCPPIPTGRGLLPLTALAAAPGLGERAIAASSEKRTRRSAMAATNKCLAQSDKSRTGGEATKKWNCQ